MCRLGETFMACSLASVAEASDACTTSPCGLQCQPSLFTGTIHTYSSNAFYHNEARAPVCEALPLQLLEPEDIELSSCWVSSQLIVMWRLHAPVLKAMLIDDQTQHYAVISIHSQLMMMMQMMHSV